MLKQAVVSVVLPLIGMGIVLAWKQLLKEETDNEDYLALLELLVTALILTIAVWANDTDARSPTARSVAAAIAVIVSVGVFPIAARLVRDAYDPKKKHMFTREDVWWANGLGVEVLVLAYFFTHISS
jgi:hypothetical protein